MAEAIAASVSQWIVSLLKREANTLCKVVDQVKGLQQELESMQEYLQDADARQEENDVRSLIRQIRKLVYDMEDVIDTYILRVPAPTEKHILKRFGRFLYNAPEIYKVGKQMKVMQGDVQRITEKLDSCGLRRIALELQDGFRKLHRENNWRARSYPFEDNSGEYVVGLEKDVSKLLEVIMGEENTHIHILSIVGMGGSGKTTLARKLYNHPYAKECFNHMAWVFISQEWSIRHILSEIVRMVGGHGGTYELHARLGAEELVDKVRDILNKKPYLIVLDDVWRREALEEILPALPLGDANRGSKIIITTRNREIIHFQNLQQLFIHEPQPLSEEESWDLFSKLALGHRTGCNFIENFKSLGMIMLKNCGGLPLAIVALAGILKMRGSIGEWQQVNDAIKLRLMKSMCSNTHGSVQDLLALSYEDLPYYLKPCFLYLGLFPEDCQIPAGMLTRMWIAEGLITAPEEISPEDVALEHLEELSHRCMIQVVRTNFKGSIKAFHLHDLLRDLCLKKAKELSFLQIYTSNQAITTFTSSMEIPPRRAALQSSISFLPQDSNLRSLLLLTRTSLLQSANVSKETVDLKIVHNTFQLLRLLNLWGIKTDNGALPKHIGTLIHLRYLGIRASNISKLPPSIGNLRNLLTLDYRNIDFDDNTQVQIPNVLWKLVQLRHLYLPMECSWNAQEELHLSGLENLRILWGVRSNGGDWFSGEMLNLSMSVKKLKVNVSTQKDLEAIFSMPNLRLHQLQTFQCQWGDGIVLGHVNPIFIQNQHLSKLILIGQIRVKNLSLLLPSNLVILELKDSVVDYEDPMAAIGALAHLKLLRLSNACMRTTFLCTTGTFLMLEELHLENLQLGKWVIEEGAMLSLKKVHISGCRKLQHFPQGLALIRTLQVFEYIGVPTEFVKEATDCGWSRKKLRLPHNFDAIIDQCDSTVVFSSINKLYEQLIAGIFLNNKRQKYWIMKQNEHYYNCFILYAASLSLCKSDPDRECIRGYRCPLDHCWEWSRGQDSAGALITMGKLSSTKNKALFDVRGEFNTEYLSVGVTYEIAYVVMLPGQASTGYRRHAICTLFCLPDDFQFQEHDLNDKPRGEWIRLNIGDIKKSSANFGKMAFSLEEIEPGVVIQGVVIEPKAQISNYLGYE